MSEEERKKSILIVDDDEGIRLTLAAILESEGYSVDTAKDGAEGIAKSNKKMFDLALVDIRLPDMMGTDLLGQLKETTPKIHKIILTGYPSMQNAIDSVNEGADGYLLKPVEAGVIIETVREHLKKRDEEAEYSQGKVIEYIETRAKAFSERETRAKRSSKRASDTESEKQGDADA